MTIIDRLLGREPAQKAVITGNGGTGPGVLAWQNDVPLWAASKNPRRLMKQAQELYHRDLIIRAAERRVSTAFAGLAWHLEDENQDEVTDESAPELIAIRDWLEKPQDALPRNRRQAQASTRSNLWFLTSRHFGLCGTSFWLSDQRTLLTGQPLATLYINPARMYPAQDENGNLVGWKLDADEDGNGGIPLELEEVVQFDLEPPDWGHYGIGLVESAGMVAEMGNLATRHTSAVLAAGGRLAGLIAPKTGTTVSDDQWAAAVRDWRNISSDPESAKRLHILRGPVDYTRTAATLQELSIETVYKLSRQDKLALWGIPESQLPLPIATGMNSGETKGYDEAVLYQGAVHDRASTFQEVLQSQILDPIAAAGGPKVTLVIEEPEFDDETPNYDRAQKAVDQPLTVNERRAILTLDPLPDVDAKGEPLGTAIWLPTKLTLVATGPLTDSDQFPTMPEPAPLVAEEEADDEEDEEVPVKASPLGNLRSRVDTTFVASTKRDVQTALRDQAQAVAKRVRARGEAIARNPGQSGIWWDENVENTRLRKVLEPHNVAIAQAVTTEATKVLPRKAEPFEDTVFDYIRHRTAERVVGINQTTRDALAKLILSGFAEGLGPSAVADRIEAATSFDEARAELVARTESMLAYNEASLSSYREFGVTEVEAIDGDEDAQCADRNGRIYPIAESFLIEDHPNGTLDWAPVI